MNSQEFMKMMEVRAEVTDEMLDHILIVADQEMEGIDDPDGRLTTSKIVEISMRIGTRIATQVITEYMVGTSRSDLPAEKMN